MKNKSQSHGSPGRFLLWMALLLGPIAWAVQLQAVYAFSKQACKDSTQMPLLYIITIGCLIVALAGGVCGAVGWMKSGRSLPSEYDDEIIARDRLMSTEGMLTALLFSILIVAQGLATIFVNPCP